MVVMIKCMYHQWSLWYVMILHVFSIKTIPLLRPLGLSPQGGRYRGILLYIKKGMHLGDNDPEKGSWEIKITLKESFWWSITV